MEAKLIPMLLISMLLPLVARAQDTNNAKEEITVKYTSAEYIKNYALSVCIRRGSNSEEDRNEAWAALNAYFEQGDMSLETCEQVVLLAEKYLAKRYRSMTVKNVKFTVMKCIDLYHSKELDQTVKQDYKEKVKSAKKDPYLKKHLKSPNQKF